MIVLKSQNPDNHTIIKVLLLIDLLKSRGDRITRFTHDPE